METIYELYGTSNTLLFREENVLEYIPGGYHPVALKDNFKSHRYQVRHKLGYGGFSTVWLAWDNNCDRWVTLKILTAEQTKCSRELDSLQQLEGCCHVVLLLDHFIHEGPNGLHQCLVLEFLGPTLNVIVEDYHHDEDDLDITEILKMAKELLEAVASIHAAGFAHGDLSPKNIAFRAPRLSSITQEDLFTLLGQPETEVLYRSDGRALGDGVPQQLVKSAEWPGWPDADIHSDDDTEDDAHVGDGTYFDAGCPEICLIDLGEAFRKDLLPQRLAQPGGMQAPEIIFTNSFNHKIDLWRAGLIIYYLAFGAMPFEWDGIDVLAASMIDFTGELPAEWRQLWMRLKDGSKSKFVLNLDESVCPAESSLKRKHNTHKDDMKLQPLLSVIAGLMRLSPSDRTSASQALQILKGAR